uniref:Endonuclease/exonuclease/phosphatase domain-containing protein n=1 Tax=Vitis vinifera TaxID=29760 RepID=A5B2V0_VITVI|nr:hypothetical protein VITISV_007376 [Vitis vinifera]
MRRFTKVIDDLHLRNLPLLGGSSTWSEGLNNQAYLRLDRFLVSEGWEGHFSNVLQCVLPKPVSDHSPILLDVGGMRRGPSPFRFEKKLKKLKGFLKSWNFEVFGNVAIRKNLTLTQVGFWDSQELLGTLSIKEEIAKKASRVEFRKWALMEETSWRQKSREVWLKEEEADIKAEIVQAFQALLSKSGDWHPSISGMDFETLNRQDAAKLEEPFTEEEVSMCCQLLMGTKP